MSSSDKGDSSAGGGGGGFPVMGCGGEFMGGRVVVFGGGRKDILRV